MGTHGSILGPLFFNTFINDIFLIISSRSLCSFADDNTIIVSANNSEELNELVKRDTMKCIEWLNHNHVTANKSKFQSLVVSKQHTNIEELVVNNDFKIKVSDTVTLLGVQIDNRLKFDSHVQKICTKESLQLNCPKRLTRYLGSNEKFILMNSFILSLLSPYLAVLQQGQSAEIGKA